MSTNCLIGIKRQNESIDYIYCHFDGYPGGVGKILKKHYTDRRKINKLISMGDLSSLGKIIGRKVDFDSFDTESDQCLFYHRDRGEPLEKHNSFTEGFFFQELEGVPYIYLFMDNVWNYAQHSSKRFTYLK